MRPLLTALVLLSAGCARAPYEWAIEIEDWCTGTLSYDGPPEELSGTWECAWQAGNERVRWHGPLWGEMPDARSLRLVLGNRVGGGVPVQATIRGEAADTFTGTAGGAPIAGTRR